MDCSALSTCGIYIAPRGLYEAQVRGIKMNSVVVSFTCSAAGTDIGNMKIHAATRRVWWAVTYHSPQWWLMLGLGEPFQQLILLSVLSVLIRFWGKEGKNLM